MAGHFVQFGHQRVEWVFVDQRDFHVVVLAEDFVQGFACFYARIATADDEYPSFHMIPSRCYCESLYALLSRDPISISRCNSVPL